MNATVNTPIVRELTHKRSSRTRSPSILVATDGSETSLAAYNAAELIAAEIHARVHVLSVLEPLPTIMPPPGTPILATGVDKSREDALRIAMVEQLLKLGKLAQWSTEIRLGKPPSVIAEVAKERNVDLVIVGASRHGVVDRLFGEETATQLARRIERPLLVAAPLIARLPKRAVIALDLSPADRSSFVTVLEMVGTPHSVSVLHVVPRSEALGVDWAEYDHEYRAEVESAFCKLNERLGALPRMESDLVVMHGDAAREINQFAQSVKAELIVLGVKRRGAFSITPGGGIAMKVVRAAECSVLLVPSHA
jgi:nucleotide-binding universal stress UspA family protein